MRRTVRDPIDPHVETSVLDNGLRVVTVQLPHLHTCTLALYLRAGPRFETPAENGLSHMVEHMLFRGTARHRSARALSSAIDSLGAVLDGATDRDLGVLHMSLPPERLGAGLDLLGEVVLRPRFADLEAERALVLEEMSEDYDEDGVETNTEDLACGAQFGGHPLGQRILGPRANVERFTAADVRRHHARVYAARNAVLCAAGPVVHAAVAAGAARHFGGMRTGLEAEAEPAPPVAAGPRTCHSPSSGPLVSLTLTLRGITRRDPAAYAAFEALLRVLDGGMSGRVYERLCLRDGLAYSVDAEIVDHVDATLLQFTSEVAPANLGRVVGDTLGVLSALARRPVSAGELARVREGYRFSLLAQLDDAAAMAEWFGAAALFQEPLLPSARLALMSRVSARDVMLAARRVAQTAGLALAVVGPVSRARLRALRRTGSTGRAQSHARPAREPAGGAGRSRANATASPGPRTASGCCRRVSTGCSTRPSAGLFPAGARSSPTGTGRARRRRAARRGGARGMVDRTAHGGRRAAATAAGHDVGRALRRARRGPGRPLIYLDTSVALAHLLAEDRQPPEALWRQSLVASRLVEYELWTRLNARRLAGSHGELVRRLLERLAILEMLPNVLARALEPFPAPVRMLDALHLASMEFLRARGQSIELASYDERLIASARALSIPIAAL